MEDLSFEALEQLLSGGREPPPVYAYYLALAVVAGGTLLLAVVGYLMARWLIRAIISRVAARTRFTWDDFLVQRRFFPRVAHFVPAMVIYFCAAYFPSGAGQPWTAWVQQAALSYLVLAGVLAVDAVLGVLVDVYSTRERARTNPIKGFVQGAKILLYLVGGVLFFATLMRRDPTGIVAGIGAVTAVLLLVFKDSILGLVASIQINVNNLVNLGDWIEMPKYGADGDVVDITLTSVRVRNWDNTYTTIPTYALIADSFKNWRGMQEAGGRRIKRALAIDMTSVRFCDEAMLGRFERANLLTDYVRSKRQELAEFNRTHQLDDSAINGRRLTNLGTFRAYLRQYLRSHPKTEQNMTLLVRHLAPTADGLPIEIYVFSADTAWGSYEDMQADIFDHILAVLPEFDLRVFQHPAGSDFRRLVADS